MMSPVSVATVVPTKNDSDVILCLQLLSKTPTCTLHLSYCSFTIPWLKETVRWILPFHQYR